MKPHELKAACDEAECQLGAASAYIIVTAPPRRVWHRTYRICQGLSGNVVGGSRAGVYIALKCTKVRRWLKQFSAADLNQLQRSE